MRMDQQDVVHREQDCEGMGAVVWMVVSFVVFSDPGHRCCRHDGLTQSSGVPFRNTRERTGPPHASAPAISSRLLFLASGIWLLCSRCGVHMG